MSSEDDDYTINESDSIAKLAMALSKAQGEFESLSAGRIGQEGHRTYRYADLNSVLAEARKVLPKHDLAIVQRPLDSGDPQDVVLETKLVHASGEWMSGTMRMRSANTTPKGIGSAITYARRYSLTAMLGLSVEDDDGASAGKSPGPAAKVHVNAGEPLCNESHRRRILDAARSLEWTPERLVEVLGNVGKSKVAELTASEATSLAERLEKKFLEQQAKETFS